MTFCSVNADETRPHVLLLSVGSGAMGSTDQVFRTFPRNRRRVFSAKVRDPIFSRSEGLA